MSLVNTIGGLGTLTSQSGILDVLSVPAACAVSLRLLRLGYTGPVVQVRRNSDLLSNNFIADINGNLSNVQNGTTLQTFLSATTGNVLTWYDQSGQGRNATGTNSTLTPTSNLNQQWAVNTTLAGFNVAGGAFLNGTDFTITCTSKRLGTMGNDAVYGYGANSGWVLQTSVATTYGNNTRFALVMPNAGLTTVGFLDSSYQDAITSASVLPASFTGATEPTISTTVTLTAANQRIYVNGSASGASISTLTQVTANASTIFTIGTAAYYSSGFIGEMGEFIIFPRALTPDQISSIYRNQLSLPIPRSGLTGTPLFSQLSQAATSSAVGAFSLRAVNGGTAKAVAVRAYPAVVVQWPPVAMTSNTTVISGQLYGNGTYVATASVPNSTIWYIFDNNINTYYEQATAFPYNLSTGTYIGSNATTISSVSVSGEWFQIQSPTSIILRSYTLVGRQDNGWWANRTPTTFWIAGSNDGSNWSNVHQQTNITPPQEGITINVPITSNSLPWTYHRLVVNVIGNSNSVVNQRNLVNLASWNLYGDAPSYDFYADRLGNLLTAPVTGQPLASWLGGATGYVTTWYDQSGAGKDVTQAIAANQPVINLGTSPYSLIFNGTSTTMFNSNFTFNFGTNYQYTIRAVVNNTVGGVLLYKGVSGATWTTGAKKWWLGTLGGGEATVGGYPNEVGNAEGYIFGQTAISSTKSSVTWSSSAYSSMTLYENASAVGVVYAPNAARSDPGNYLYIGSGGASTNYGGNIYEIEIFGSTLGLSDVTICQ